MHKYSHFSIFKAKTTYHLLTENRKTVQMENITACHCQTLTVLLWCISLSKNINVARTIGEFTTLSNRLNHSTFARDQTVWILVLHLVIAFFCLIKSPKQAGIPYLGPHCSHGTLSELSKGSEAYLKGTYREKTLQLSNTALCNRSSNIFSRLVLLAPGLGQTDLVTMPFDTGKAKPIFSGF